MKNTKCIVYIMGVSGSGKTTIGKLLAHKMGIPFFDGDDYHPEANVKKMADGHPLNDNDRQGWLQRLNNLAKVHKYTGTIIACSSLKKKYRDILTIGLQNEVEFVFLKGTYEEVSQRLEKRKGHFMPPELLRSQFDTLEIPNNAIAISIKNTPEAIVSEILKRSIPTKKP